MLRSTALLLLLLTLFPINDADNPDDGDVTTYQKPHHGNDVTVNPKVFFSDPDFGEAVRAKYLNVLERKLKFPRYRLTGSGERNRLELEDKRRSWAENSMSSWGKRLHAPPQGGPRVKRSAPHRRRWSENSMAVWGKRRIENPFKDTSKEFLEEDDKLNENALDWVPPSGILRHEDQFIPDQGPSSFHFTPAEKRRWSDNSMSVWGKRAGMGAGKTVDSDNETDPEFYLPSGAHSPYSGRNPNQLYFALLNYKNGGPKRNWATNTMNVWGKRSTPQNENIAEGYDAPLHTVAFNPN